MWMWLFFASLLLNMFAAAYIRWLLKTVSYIVDDITDLTVLVSQFNNHVKSIYELEMFYGDDTLKGLIDHSKDLLSSIEDLDLILNEDENDDTTPPPQED